MATQTRPFMMTGVALASAAAIATTAPAVVPGHIAGLPTPLSLSQAQYELTALADISIQGAITAFTTGWGGFIGADDPYFPGEFANDALLNGFTGVGYYLVDQAVEGIVPFNLENYFFEVGSQDPSNFVYSGATAAAYVGVSEVFGADSLPAQFIGSLVTGSSSIGDAIVALTAGIPVVGDLTSVYFTGLAPNDATEYGTGITGVLSYALQKVLPGIFGGGTGLDIGGIVAAAVGLVSGLVDGIGWGGGWSDDEEDDDDDWGWSGWSDDEGDDDDHGWGWGHHNRSAAAAAAVTASPSADAGEATAATARATAAEADQGAAAAAAPADSAADTPAGDSADTAGAAEAPAASAPAAAAEPAEAPKAAAKAGAANRGGKKAKAESTAGDAAA